MELKNVFVFAALTILVPMCVYWTVGKPTFAYRFIDPWMFLVYFTAGLLGGVLAQRWEYSTSDALAGSLIGVLIYPIDTLPFLASERFYAVLPDVVLKIAFVCLGAYLAKKLRRSGI
jgi:CHASE2 domain-containing sensor protein